MLNQLCTAVSGLARRLSSAVKFRPEIVAEAIIFARVFVILNPVPLRSFEALAGQAHQKACWVEQLPSLFLRSQPRAWIKGQATNEHIAGDVVFRRFKIDAVMHELMDQAIALMAQKACMCNISQVICVLAYVPFNVFSPGIVGARSKFAVSPLP